MRAVHVGLRADTRSLEDVFRRYRPEVAPRRARSAQSRTTTLLAMNVATWAYATVVLAQSL